MEEAYKIGDVKITIDDRNPETYYGYGEWQLLSPGDTIVCTAESGVLDTLRERYGRKDTVIIDHVHTYNSGTTGRPFATQTSNNCYSYTTGNVTLSYVGNATQTATGNIMPSIACYMWERIA